MKRIEGEEKTKNPKNLHCKFLSHIPMLIQASTDEDPTQIMIKTSGKAPETLSDPMCHALVRIMESWVYGSRGSKTMNM